MRLVALGLVAALDLGLAALLVAPRPTPTVHPLVPPLTRVAALRDHPLAAPAGAAGDLPPAGFAGLAQVAVRAATAAHPGGTAAELAGRIDRRRGGLGDGHRRSVALRLAVEADAQALAAALGPERVSLAVAERERLSDVVGEGRLWRRAGEAVREAGPTP